MKKIGYVRAPFYASRRQLESNTGRMTVYRTTDELDREWGADGNRCWSEDFFGFRPLADFEVREGLSGRKSYRPVRVHAEEDGPYRPVTWGDRVKRRSYIIANWAVLNALGYKNPPKK